MRSRQQLPFLGFALAGLALVLWLLLSPPASGVSGGECRPALSLGFGKEGREAFEDSKASVSDDADWGHQVLNLCSGKQNTRLSWALLAMLPTSVAAAAAWARRPRPSAQEAHEPR
ncbi:hypothetical protein GCM10009654_51070 [Streptomyces hebeiensis]|uniref:Uncharacterized protein n=1 Tax=Streptomyces hebeiensis TaxID=229486 RepID=A0ABN1V135_9ACTN